MKIFILALSLAFASVASAKSACAVLEKDENGSLNRVVAQKMVETEGQAEVLHKIGNSTIFVYLEGEMTTIGIATEGQAAIGAMGNGVVTAHIDMQRGFGVVCQRQ